MMKQHSSSREKSKNNHKNNSRWTVTKEELVGEQSTPWREMTPTQRAERIACIIFKLALLLFVIFIFICTLGLLAEAFKLIGQAVKNNKFIQNPVSASIIGMVITLVLQSSSTLISILVGMVAGGLITVHQAIPMHAYVKMWISCAKIIPIRLAVQNHVEITEIGWK